MVEVLAPDAAQAEDEDRFARCATSTTVHEACAGLVADLYQRWGLPSVYLLMNGRLRCQASRGYFQVSDGFSPATGVVGRVVTTGETVVIEDVRTEPEFIAAIPNLRAEVCAPVSVGGEVVGAVNLESFTVLGNDAVDAVTRAARFLAVRLEQLGGLGEVSLTERLARLAVALAAQTDPDVVRRQAVDGAEAISGMRSAAIASCDSSGVWVVDHVDGPLGPLLSAWDDAVLRFLAGWVRAGASSHFPDGEDVPSGYEFLGGVVQALSVQPLVVGATVTGLLLTADAQPLAHDPAVATAMELFATQTGATLAMAQTLRELEHQAKHDSLTGLCNRRHLLEVLGAACVATPSGQVSGTALVLLDLDGFKTVNDHYGHSTGDAVLQAVARQLEGCAGPQDVVCRLGGDEFAVLVHGVTSPEEALEAGVRFVAAARAGAEGEIGVGASPVSASAGVRLVGDCSAGTVLLDADVALYGAKRDGRGHAVVWTRVMTDAERTPPTEPARRSMR